MKNWAKVDLRDAFFDEIYELAKADRNVIMITDDMDAWGLRKFKRNLPKQFINIGVSEQNMMDVAAGMASCGKKVFTYGIGNFVTMRCFEQIKFSICSMNFPITIIGVGSGFSFAFDGPTHHGTSDLAIMRTLPEMTIYNPSEAILASKCAEIAYSLQSPAYIRLDKGLSPKFYSEADSFKDGFKVIKPIYDVNIISTGYMTKRAVSVFKKLAAKKIRVGVIDLFQIKPLSKKFKSIIVKSKKLVTLEENSYVGGLGSLIAEQLADLQKSIFLKRIAVLDKQFLNYGSREWFHRKNAINEESIVKNISEWI